MKLDDSPRVGNCTPKSTKHLIFQGLMGYDRVVSIPILDGIVPTRPPTMPYLEDIFLVIHRPENYKLLRRCETRYLGRSSKRFHASDELEGKTTEDLPRPQCLYGRAVQVSSLE
jgi:hypothetical protein